MEKKGVYLLHPPTQLYFDNSFSYQETSADSCGFSIGKKNKMFSPVREGVSDIPAITKTRKKRITETEEQKKRGEELVYRITPPTEESNLKSILLKDESDVIVANLLLSISPSVSYKNWNRGTMKDIPSVPSSAKQLPQHVSLLLHGNINKTT